MFILSMHSLRAIAMLLIVAGHCFPFSFLYRDNDLWGQLVFNVISNGSSLFVLISGFFFHHVFYARFDYGRFLKKKIKNVVCPYLFLSVIVVLLFRLGQPDPRLGGFFEPQGTGIIDLYLIPFIKYLIFGGATTAYWYIPFIFLMFCLSPLHKKYADLGLVSSLVILLLSFLLSMLVHRPQYNLNVFQSLIYYQSFYLAGILFSKYYQPVSQWIVRNLHFLILVFLLCNFAMAYVYPVANLQDGTVPYTILERYVPFKLLEFFVLYGLFERFAFLNVKPLSWFADMSFAVYFIHPIVIAGIKEHWLKFDLSLPWIQFWLSCFLVIAVCMLLAVSLKKAFGDRTRVFVGW
ncbi:acyltransferase [Pseudaeromonas paramecii]|uniref:acyltransferase n=1 Tax=Pseudaeromonas paramecii TaxID=2138166 RepID=UPI0031E8030C